MKLLCSLAYLDLIDDIWEDIDGLIVGYRGLSLKYSFSLDDLVTIKKKCQMYDLAMYIDIDIMINENERPIVSEFLEFVSKLEVDGIYFADLMVYDLALKGGYVDKLIYDPVTLMTNSIDTIFFLKKGLKGVTLARELTYDEIKKIGEMTNGQIDVMISGHIRMAYSSRHFISDYLKVIQKEYEEDKRYTIREETREGRMPIVEDKHGTVIYTDFVLLALKEYVLLKDKVSRFIIDSHYLEHDLVVDLLKAHHIANSDTAKKLEEEIKKRYRDVRFEKGHLYNKTLIKKEASDDRTISAE